jgi:hypothetical protein
MGLVSLVRNSLLDLGGLLGVRKGLENLYVDMLCFEVGVDFDFDPVNHAGDYLTSD